MAIPDLVDGVLPDGIHDCTLDEIATAFGHTPHRARLMAKLCDFVRDAELSGRIAAVLIDGSFVTAKAVPGDIDLIVVLRLVAPPWLESQPFEYNPTRKAWIRWAYGFDAFSVKEGGSDYDTWFEFFTRVKSEDPDFRSPRTTKGLLRITL